MTVTTSPVPAPAPPLVMLRRGTTADQAPVAALHERCSEESRYRRFHAPLPQVPSRLVRATLEPEDGWSVLAELGTEVVGVACAGPLSTRELEVGVPSRTATRGSASAPGCCWRSPRRPAPGVTAPCCA